MGPSLFTRGSTAWAVVDASVWVSRFVDRDVNHRLSERWLLNHFVEGHRVIAPSLLLSEVGGAIVRRTGDEALSQRIVELLRSLPPVRWIPVGPVLRDDAANLAIRLRLRGADAIYVAAAYRLHVPLITWDDEQLTRSSPLLEVRRPGPDNIR